MMRHWAARLLAVIGLGIMPTAVWAGGAPTWVQEHFRWRSDDGTESSANWRALADTAITGQTRFTNIRLRFVISNTGTVSGSVVPRIEFATSTSGPWTPVSTETNGATAFEMTPTSGYADGDATTAQMTGTGGWAAGKVMEKPSNMPAAGITVNTNTHTEVEYCFRATAKAAGSGVYYFRMSNSGTAFTTYSQYASLTMAAGDANQPPLIVSPLSATGSVISGFSYRIQASGSEPITYNATSLPSGLTYDGTNSIVGIPTVPGAYSASVRATSAWGGDTQTLAITVVDNIAPVASNQTATSIAQGGEILISLAWSDADQPQVLAHTFPIVANPAHGVLTSYYQRNNNTNYPHQYYFKAATNFIGPDSFTWKCNDGKVDSNVGTVTLQIVGNNAPVASNSTASVQSGQQGGVNLIYGHADAGQAVVFSIVSGPSHGTAYIPNPTNSAYAYYSSLSDFVGTDTFTWKCNDGKDDSNIATATVTVTGTPPVPQNQAACVAMNAATDIRAAYRGGGGYTSTVVKLSNPSHGTVTITNSTMFHYVPTTNYMGTDSFMWKMTYGTNSSTTVTCSITVKDGIAGPAWNQKVVTCKGVATTAPFSRGEFGAMPMFSLVSSPSHGTLTISGANFTYTPSAGYTGTDSFTWKMSDGYVESNLATCRILVREESSRGGMTVLLVVKDTLLPEISAEVDRWKADLENEGYAAKIKSWTSTDAGQLWIYLVSEYDAVGQFVAGATVIGNMPTATGLSSGETTDYAFMNMQAFRDNGYNKQHIWVSRIYTVNFAGGEVNRAKWAMDANHGYRTGTHRLPYNAYWYDAAYGAVNAGNAANTLIVWPAISQLYPMDAFRKGGEFENSEIHSDGAFNGFDGHPSQLRYSTHSSCGPGRIGGPVNQNSCTYGGGVIMSMGSTATAYSGQNVVMDNVTYFNALAAGDTFGNGMTRYGLNPYCDFERDIFYGDLSLPAKAAPSNSVPAISAFTSDKSSGTAPVTVSFAVKASDSDGTIDNYEWFINGFSQWAPVPAYSGTATNISHIFSLPHRYPAEVHAIDNYKARAWTSKEIVVGPTPGQPVRVRCGKNFGYYAAGWDYIDGSGNVWLHDQAFASGTWGYSGGNEGYVASAVAGTESDVLYQYFRTGSSFTYKVPVTNGNYWLRLKLADMQSSAAGQRIVDVVAEGATQVYGLDVYAQAGSKTALDVPLYVEVADGELTFSVSKNAASPNDIFLNSFEVIPYSMGNRPPLAAGQTVRTAKDTPLAVTLSATDPDGDSLTYSLVKLPAHGTLSGSAPNVVYTPTNGYVGTDEFRFTAYDGSATGTVGSVSITVMGIVGWWKLDDASGTNAVDSSDRANHGILGTNGLAWTTGKFGGGLSFDGVAGSVSVASAPYAGLVNTFTMAMWVNPTAGRTATTEAASGTSGTSGQRYAIYPTQGNGAFGSGHSGAGISVGTNGVSVFEHADGYLPSLLVYNTPISGWTHVAVVYENRTPKLYVNGVLAKTGLTSTKVVHPGSSMGGSSYGWYKGDLDEVQIYNYPMSAGDVADMMAAEGVLVKPAISAPPAVTGVVGQVFSCAIEAGGTQPISLGVSGLPSGLTFNGTDLICGTPQAAGTNSVTISASNAYGATTNTLVLSILPANSAPTVAAAASASPNPVTGTTAAVSVLGADDAGEANLTYNWGVAGTPPAPVTFSANGNNAAKSATAFFTKAGSYTLRAIIRDSGWGMPAVTGTVSVTVNQTLTGVTVTPADVFVTTGAAQQFAATTTDQFGDAMPGQPAFTWSVSGGGTISTGGLFTAGSTAGGPHTVTASGGGKSGTAGLSVVDVIPGLAYGYYHGSWSSGGYLPDFDSLTAVTSGVVSTFSLAPRLRDTDFAFRYRGKIQIATAGSYTFYTSSDDGSKLSIDGSLVVNNDGPHGVVEVSGTKTLTVGFHDIEVTFCQGTGGYGLTASWAGPGISKQEIPAGVLFHLSATSSGDLNTNGMPDSWELQNFGSTNAVNGGAQDDWDNDGLKNLAEYIAGTCPTNAKSCVLCSVSGIENGAFGFSFQTVTGRLYSVKYCDDPRTNNWGSLTNNMPGTGGAINLNDAAPAARKFYRITVKMQ